MANLFDALGNPQISQPQPVPTRPNLLEQYRQFKQAFQGNPIETIKQKLQSNEFTQNQLMQAQGMLKQAYEMQNLFRVNTTPNVRR